MIVLQKALTHLAMPTGLLWLLALALLAMAWRNGQRSLLAGTFLLAAGLTASGNAWVADALTGYLEKPYVAINVLEQGPLDAVIILGGGVGETPRGDAQLSWAGDRVALGARLFLQGRTQYLVCTGSGIANLSNNVRDAAEDAALILQDLQVPPERIVRLGGRTTREEMQQLKKLMADKDWDQVGLITSAWHMQRAMRLAHAAGLDVTPLPANFESRPTPWSPVFVIPQANENAKIWWACKELLARAVGQ